MKENIHLILAGNELGINEYTSIRKDGTKYPVLIHSSPIIYEGKPIGLRGIIIDISEQKQAQEALRESEERYRILFERSPTSITLVDKSGGIIDCNKSTEEMTGYSRDEIIGKSFEKLMALDPIDLPKLKERFTNLLSGKEDGPYELEIIRKDGERRWIIILNSILKKEGDILGFQVISRDITERKKMEEALRESTQQWQTTFDTIKDPICIQDIERKIIQCNEATTSHLEKPLKYVLDHDCCKLMHGTDEPIKDCPFNRARETQKRESLVQEIEGKWFNVTVDPIIDQHGAFTGAVHMMEDITEAKKAEEELKHSLDDREILFRELKHRVKNNLQLLSSMVGMQIMRIDDETALKKFQEFQSVIETMALIYSRAYEETGIKGLNLNKFIEELINSLLKFRVDEELRVEYSIEGDNIKLNTDQAIPLALITNELIFNALKHAFKDKKEGQITISLKDEDSIIIMKVRDNGIGISEEIDTKKPDSLGLKIVNNLCEQLEGELKMVVDDGTEFTIKIPKEGVK
jgi:PAS domain S-box-containing protein